MLPLLLQMTEPQRSLAGRLSDWDRVSAPLAPLAPAQEELLHQLAGAVAELPRPSLPPAGRGAGGGEVEVGAGPALLAWLQEVESRLGAEQGGSEAATLARLERGAAALAGLADRATASLALLTRLAAQYTAVSQRTVALHTACQHLLQQQTRLAQLDRHLQERLAVFQAADKVGSRRWKLSCYSCAMFRLRTS